MRAIHFAKPFEYRLEVQAEHVSQGMALQGSLALVNRDSMTHHDMALQLALGHGTYRLVKEKGADSIEVLERHNLAQALTLEPGQEHKVAWTIPLQFDCPATTKDSSPFLIYGSDLADASRRGVIDLHVELAAPLQALVATLENRFAFEARSQHYDAGFMEVHLKPPGTYPTLEEFIMAMRIGEDGLELIFRCKLKGFQRGAKAGVTARRVEVARTVPVRDYLLGNGQPNRELYRQVLQGVLQEVTPAALTKPT
ncbi:MAG TPA: hypothetical protein VL359_03495 [bacterium]|nr:hypothetical protein [bacterium]